VVVEVQEDILIILQFLSPQILMRLKWVLVDMVMGIMFHHPLDHTQEEQKVEILQSLIQVDLIL
tara:strand:+ start:1146 stop:1337 length:192 start_codon:yes stop_codon:yes gene_type:complete